jgi:3-hydroxyanthranilate 3,4-dioxygenase
MQSLQAFNFKQWIEANRAQLKPPVGNKRVFRDGDFIIMVVGGPNARNDYHVDPGQEFFYQLEGDMVLRTVQDGRALEVPIRAGEVLLIPPRLPHCPQRPAGTLGLVIERARRAGELPVVLRALRAAAVRGVLRAHGHREAIPAGIRALLRKPGEAHLQPLRRGHGALLRCRRALRWRGAKSASTCRARSIWPSGWISPGRSRGTSAHPAPAPGRSRRRASKARWRAARAATAT